MATTIRQTESAPESYQAIDTTGWSAEAALSQETIWQRLEPYLALRWSEREVVWIVEGPGEWSPPLAPASIETVEVWSCGADAWQSIEVNPSPLGFWLSASGPFRFTATVGGSFVRVST